MPKTGRDSDQKELMTKIAQYVREPLSTLRAASEILAREMDEPPGKRGRELLQTIEKSLELLGERIEELLWMAQIGSKHASDAWAESLRADPADDRRKKQASARRAASEPSLPLGPPMVLIVDDDPVTTRILEEMITARGFDVRVAGNGAEAVDQARLYRPAIITMDLAMPEVDGGQVSKILKGDPETKDIPIILLSATINEERFADIQADSFLKKPVDEGTLVETIERILSFQREKSAPPRGTILVVDDSHSVVRILTGMLRDLGYDTIEAHNGTEAIALAARRQPSLVILDFLLHRNFDGLEVLRRLKNSMSTCHIPVILLSAAESPQDKAKGLRLGADDYITKPFSPLELGARLEMILRRTETEYSASPTTRLPGSIAIERIIAQKVESREPFAVCYCDLDNFKAYNDTYGFAKGDSVIRQTARVILDAVRNNGRPEDFVGHIGGDDFIAITAPDLADPVCTDIVGTFDRLAPLYYDEEARRLGYIEEKDRQGRPTKFPLMSISIAVVTNEGREITHAAQVADIAAEVKKRAKMTRGSCFVRDRRKSDADQDPR